MPVLRKLARRTWLFYETFVGPDDHWLPPDNYQESPLSEVAHRTSPTNIGMLCTPAWRPTTSATSGRPISCLRLRNALRTVDQLEHHRGHLLNWYDTRSLAPLLPRYVSSVDSGNLAAALLAVESGLKELVDRPILPATRWQGLVDTISVLQDEHQAADRGRSVAYYNDRPAEPVDGEHGAGGAGRPGGVGPHGGVDRGAMPGDRGCAGRDGGHSSGLGRPGGAARPRSWLARVHNQILDMQQEITFLAPWLGVLDAGRGLDVDAGEIADLADTSGRDHPTPAANPPARAGRPALATTSLAVIAKARTAWSSEELPGDTASVVNGWLDDLDKAVTAGAANARELQSDLTELAAHAERETLGMDFGLLYDTTVRHFFLGYNLTANQMDPHHYDLLASEARLASFVAIAKGDVPVSHWFSLERPLTRIDGIPTLLSWGGTMFEYLMPPLLLRSRSDTLLAVSQRAAVVRADCRRPAPRHPLGNLGIGFRRRRRRPQLPVPGVRGPGTRPEAGARR